MTSAPATDAELSVSVERRPGSLVELRVEAPASEVDRAVETALRRLAARVRIPGFRPGKAPAPMVERALGWAAVRHEAADAYLPQLVTRALEQASIEPVSEPRLEIGEFERGRPVAITVTVTVRPEVELGDYLEVRVDEEHTEIDDARVDEAVAEVRRRHAELIAVERPVEVGDMLRATLVLRRNGEVLAGQNEERDLEVDRDKLLDGLADALVGLRAGETSTAELTLPDDYPRTELRGVTVSVEATVHAVRERRLPPLDDSLAALEHHGTTLDELRDHLRTELVAEAEEQDRQRFEAEVLDRFADRAQVEVPEVMIDAEIERQIQGLALQLASTGLQLERYLEYSGRTIDQLRGERRAEAGRQVRLRLVLGALADAEGLEVDESDVAREVERVGAGRKVSREQTRRLENVARADLRLRIASQRAVEIARGED